MTGETRPVQSVIIAGSGYRPYLAAYFLASKLSQPKLEWTVVELPEEVAENPLICTLSSMKAFNNDLGIKEREFIESTSARPHLAVRYRGWGSGRDGDFMFSDGAYGFILQGTHFHQLFRRFQAHNPTAKLDSFSLSARLARLGHFAPVSTDPRSIFSTVSYGYVLHAHSYQKYLKALCARAGINIVDSVVLLPEIGADQNIKCVRVAEGRALSADFFIDCTSGGSLISELDSSLTSVSEMLSRVSVSVQHETLADEEPIVWSQISAEERMSLRRAVVLGGIRHERTYHYCPPTQKNPSDSAGSQLKPAAATLGRAWVGNCAALGPAFANLPSMLIDPTHVLQTQLYLLLSAWPAGPSVYSQKVFEARMKEAAIKLAELSELHFLCHPDFERGGQVDSDAARRLELFQSFGGVASCEGDLFQLGHWAAFFYSLGIVPAGYELLADQPDSGWLDQQLRSMQALIDRAALASKTSDQWLGHQ